MNLKDVPLEELKKELRRRGYYSHKTKTLPKFKPCTCGCTMHHTWWCDTKVALECVKCHKRIPYCKSQYEARVTWNKMVTGDKK